MRYLTCANVSFRYLLISGNITVSPVELENACIRFLECMADVKNAEISVNGVYRRKINTAEKYRDLPVYMYTNVRG